MAYPFGTVQCDQVLSHLVQYCDSSEDEESYFVSPQKALRIPSAFQEMFDDIAESGKSESERDKAVMVDAVRRPQQIVPDPIRMLYTACSSGDFETVLQLVKDFKSLDLRHKLNQRCRPLHYAVAYGNLDMVRCLVEVYSCNPNSKCSFGSTPLHYACYYGHVKVVKYLIRDQKCDPFEQNYDEKLPLHYTFDTTDDRQACLPVHYHSTEREKYRQRKVGHYEILKFLVIDCPYNLQKHDKINKLNIKVIFHLACEYGKLEDVVYLVEERQIYPRGCSYISETSPVHVACQNGRLNLLKYLIEGNGCKTGVQDLEENTPLHLACKHKHLQIVNYLVSEQHCDPAVTNNKHELPLHLAAQSSCLKIVKLVSDFCKSESEISFRALGTSMLIGEAVKKNLLSLQDMDGNTSLHLACKVGSLDIVKFLVMKGSNQNVVNHLKQLPLHLACTQQCLEMVQLVSNCDINCQEVISSRLVSKKAMYTPLHVACKDGTLEMVKFLMEKKADPNIKTWYGELPLHFACERESLEMVKLVSNCTNVNQMARGCTALHVACRSGHLSTVEYLIKEKHCDLQISGEHKKLPIHYACTRSLEVVILLSTVYKCNLECRTSEGIVPMHFACKNGRLEIVKYLIEARQCDPLVQDENGLNALFYASGYEPKQSAYKIINDENIQVVKYLVSAWSFSPLTETKFVISPMENAIIMENHELIKALLGAKIFCNLKNNTLVHMACKHKQLEAVTIFIREGLGNMTVQNKEGKLPLHIACDLNDINIARCVSECDVNIAEYNLGDTPLHIACRNSNEDLVKFLIEEKNGDPTIQNKAKKLPLHIACERGSLNIVKLVSDCDVNTETEAGNNPLHTLHYWLSDMSVMQEIAKYLVQEKGCDPTVGNMRYIPIVDACKRGDLKLLQALTTPSSLKYQDKSGNTLLHIASMEEQKDTVVFLTAKKLIQHDAQNEDGNTALHEACLICSLDIAKHVSSDCSPDIQNKDGDTPLHIACNCERDGNYIAEFLIKEKHCDVNIQNSQGMAPIHIAVCNGSKLIVQLLCKINPQVFKLKTADGNTPLHLVLKEGSINTLQYLLKQLAVQAFNPFIISNDQGDVPLHTACKRRSLEMVYLVGSNPDGQNNDGDTPLHIACRNGDLKITQYLVNEMLCNTTIRNRKGELPLHLAAQHTFDITKAASKDIQDPNLQTATGDTPLHIAWRCREFKAAQYLFIEMNCNPNLQNNNGELPLHLACQYIHDPNKMFLNSKQLATFTAEYFAAARHAIDSLCSLTHDLNLPNISGDTPLHLACRFATTDIVKFLINHPAVQNSMVIPNNRGELPLHIACCRNLTEIVEMVSHCNSDAQLIEGGTPIQISEQYTSYHNDCDNTTLAGDTALHIACRTQNIDLVAFLVQKKHQNANIQNNKGELPLHIACKLVAVRNKTYKSSEMIKLVSECNPNLQTESGDTPLHLLCSVIADNIYSESIYDHLMMVRYLVQVKNCDLSVQNCGRQLPLHMVCTIASLRDSFSWLPLSDEASLSKEESNLEVIQMVCERTTDINLQTLNGDTPLHIACRNQGDEKIIECLLKLNRSNFAIVNNDSELPLHIACRNCSLNVVKQVSLCDVNSQTVTGDTPLHKVCGSSHHTHDSLFDIIQFLIEVRNADTTLTNSLQELPLHLACRRQSLEMAKLVCTCNPNAKTEMGNTPLHELCKQREDYEWQDEADSSGEDDSSTESNISSHFDSDSYPFEPPMEFLRFLIEEKSCDPGLQNKKGRTPLHYLCASDAIKAVQYLLSTGRVNPSMEDDDGKTPIMLTTTLEITKLLVNHGADATPLYKLYRKYFQGKNPPPTPLKILVVGNTSMGKTTLIESLKNESHEATVAEPKLHTAGIIPNDFASKTYGSVILYDFAGQHEYYASHEAVVHNIIKKSPPVILLLISIAESEDDIRKKLLYWISFIDNRCTLLSEKPHLIVIGSHADIVQSAAQIKMNKIAAFLRLSRLQKSLLTFVAAIAMDCRQSHSPEICKLRQLLEESSAKLRDVAVMNFISHCFCVLFQDRFQHLPAIQIKQITNEIPFSAAHSKGKLEALLPTDTTHIINICEDLNDKGHVIFLKNESSPLSSWVILKKEDLLATVNGSVFAPVNFDQYRDLASSTGVVPFSKFKVHFQRHDPNMLIGFLSHMEFCQEVCDNEILKLLSDDSKVTYLDHSSEQYFFFPRLVGIVTPHSVWKKNSRFGYQWGWMLQTTDDDQFFTPHFLQVLILRLSFSYALAPSKPCKSHDLPTIKRACSVWKRGICWTNRDGVETLVEVLEQNQAVVVMMRCFQMLKSQVQCLHLRSSIIQKVLKAKDEFCPRVSTLESFIHPDDLQYPPKPGNETVLFHMSGIAQTVVEMNLCVHDDSDVGEIISTEELLLFEPYCDVGKNLIALLFDQKNEDLKVSEAFIHNIATSIINNNDPKYLERKKDLLLKILEPQSTEHMLYELKGYDPEIPVLQFKRLFQVWCSHSEGTYGHLRRELDKYSIFCGRNPQEMAGTTAQQDSKRHNLGDSLPATSSSSHEYDQMIRNYDLIINQLASVRCSGELADKLRSKKLISDQVYEEGINFGPGIVESTRIRAMINAVLAKVSLNKEHYCTFISILAELEGLEDMIHLLQGPEDEGSVS